MTQVGIIGLDLGVTTGYASGIWNPALRDSVGLWSALARGKQMKHRQIYSEDIAGAGEAVCAIVLNQIAEWNMYKLMPMTSIRVVIEDFQAKPGKVRGGKAKDKLAPVFLSGMVICSMRSIKMGKAVLMVDPSLSKSKASDARLKDWGRQCRPKNKMGWIVGKQHARDACRLIAVGLDKEV